MFQAGVSSVINISEFISAGITILNPPLLRTSKQENSRCASVFSFGAGFQPASVMYTGVELRKEEGLPLNIIFTLQHHFDKKFSAGLNWSALENQPFVCTGWETSRFKFEAGCGYHMNLGPSPSISVIINKINN